MMATTVVRFKYYHAWLLADAICNNSGIGFNGYDDNGKSQWDLISNINVINFEVSVGRSRPCVIQINSAITLINSITFAFSSARISETA